MTSNGRVPGTLRIHLASTVHGRMKLGTIHLKVKGTSSLRANVKLPSENL